MALCSATARSTGKSCQRHAVADGRCSAHPLVEEAAPAGPLSAIAATGDRRRTLEVMRQVLTAAIDDGPAPRDLAALTRRLQLVLSELDNLRPDGKSAEESKVDEVAERRRAKLAQAKGQ